jgi:hypothetical protein
VARPSPTWRAASVGDAQRFPLDVPVDHGDAEPQLSLHLLQNCMVYVNTLMLQQVLAQPQWQGQLTATDLRALTPLTWEHVNPYCRFELDMTTRLPLHDPCGGW